MKALIDRRSRFEERVRVERLFLEPINRHFGDKAILAGMTEASIKNWSERAARASDRDCISELSSILVEASKRARLLADNSRDVFEKHLRGTPDGLEALSALLRSRLSLLDSNPTLP